MSLNLDALGEAVRALCRSGQFVQARSLCINSFSLAMNDAERAELFRKRAYVEDAAGDLPACISLLKEARGLDPSGRAILHSLMVALVNLAEYSDASKVCQSLVELDKQFAIQSFTASAFFHLAICEYNLGGYEVAESALANCRNDYKVWIRGGLLAKTDLIVLIDNGRNQANSSRKPG